MCCLWRPEKDPFVGDSVTKAAFEVTEELTFHQFARNSAEIHGHKSPFGIPVQSLEWVEQRAPCRQLIRQQTL